MNNIYDIINEEIINIEKKTGCTVYLGGSYYTGEYVYPYSDIDLRIFDKYPTKYLKKLKEYTNVEPKILCKLLYNHITYLFVYTYEKYNIQFQITIKTIDDKKNDLEDERVRKYKSKLGPYLEKRNEFLLNKKIFYENTENTKKEIRDQYYYKKRTYFNLFRTEEDISYLKIFNIGNIII